MNYLILIIPIVFILIFFIFCSYENKKLKNFIMNEFGKKPSNKECEFESIGNYNFYKNLNVSNSKRIDDITWNDLDMDKVFMRINSCATSIGEEYLYNILHEPNFDENILIKREKLIKYLEVNPQTRIDLQMILAKMGKSNYNGMPSFLFNPKSKALKYPALYKILSAISVISIFIIFKDVYIGSTILIVLFVLNIIVYYNAKWRIESGLQTMNYFSSMLWCCKKICKSRDDEFKSLIIGIEGNYNNFKSLGGTLSGFMKKGFSDFDLIFEYIKVIFLIDLINYNKIISSICKNIDSFRCLYENLAEVDLAICIMSYRKSLEYYSNPVFINTKKLYFEDLFHPLITSPISNSGTMDKNIIITGSNASGKSTFVKALAINGILAQTIYTCTAKEYKTRFSLPITSMAIRDNLSLGDSYFIVEIKSLKRIIDKLDTVNCICYIDEILKGTNTIERIAASASVLEYLNSKNCLCIVASHDIELTEILKNLYDNYHFCEHIADNGIKFDYKLKKGPSKTRNAIKLLSYMKFENEIVERAEILVDDFLNQKKS